MTRWEELGMTPEEYVRSRWGEVAIGEITGCLYMMRDGLYQKVLGLPENAAAFTADHEEQIRLIRLVIVDVRDSDMPQGTIEYLLKMLDAQLAELLKGWKE